MDGKVVKKTLLYVLFVVIIAIGFFGSEENIYLGKSVYSDNDVCTSLGGTCALECAEGYHSVGQQDCRLGYSSGGGGGSAGGLGGFDGSGSFGGDNTSNGTNGGDSECGNGVKESGEQCDNYDFGSYGMGIISCSEYNPGFVSGNLNCNSYCDIITTECETECGDGIIAGNEECEPPNDFGGRDCEWYGYNAGELGCYPVGHQDECTIDEFTCYIEGPGDDDDDNGEGGCSPTILKICTGYCGDGYCDPGESPMTCSQDCPLGGEQGFAVYDITGLATIPTVSCCVPNECETDADCSADNYCYNNECEPNPQILLSPSQIQTLSETVHKYLEVRAGHRINYIYTKNGITYTFGVREVSTANSRVAVEFNNKVNYLQEGESEKYDLDGDKVKDVQLMLLEIGDGNSCSIIISELSAPILSPVMEFFGTQNMPFTPKAVAITAIALLIALILVGEAVKRGKEHKRKSTRRRTKKRRRK